MQASAVVEEDRRDNDAVAFKNRLVGYDRNAAQRTKVIDDQSDYFEIDSNTWLSQQVCILHGHAQAQHMQPCHACAEAAVHMGQLSHDHGTANAPPTERTGMH